MLKLEEWMDLQSLYQAGVSVSEMARQTGLDRKTVRRHLLEAPQSYQRAPRPQKIDPYRAYLRERWEQGVHNACKLFREIQRRGYPGGRSQVGCLLQDWREEEAERAFVRFETSPGEQSQIDWGSFGNWGGRRLYGFALVLGYSRMRYVEFTQRQDMETLLSCMIHAFHYLGGITQVVLADNMKTVVLDRANGEIHWNPRFLDFASYYGFVPQVCRPYRPQTKGKIESTIRFVKGNFWPGLQFASLLELNRLAFEWCEEVNHRRHATTGEVPYQQLVRERLRPIAGQPDYDTSYASFRQVAKDCLLSYRGNRYSAPHRYAGKNVVVREPVEGGRIWICYQEATVAEHRLAEGRGQTVIDGEHYQGLPGRKRLEQPDASGLPTALRLPELAAGPGVGRHYPVPEVAVRPLAVYEEVAHVATV